jgi:hypothetical protein
MLSTYQKQICESVLSDLQKRSSIALQHFNIYSNTEGNVNAQLASRYQEETEIYQTLKMLLAKGIDELISTPEKPAA